MSVKVATQFIERVRGDVVLQDKFTAIKSLERGAAVSAVVELAGEYGAHFEAEHFAEAAVAHVENGYVDDTELGDQELEQIVLGCRGMANATNCTYGCSCTENTYQRGCR